MDVWLFHFSQETEHGRKTVRKRPSEEWDWPADADAQLGRLQRHVLVRNRHNRRQNSRQRGNAHPALLLALHRDLAPLQRSFAPISRTGLLVSVRGHLSSCVLSTHVEAAAAEAVGADVLVVAPLAPAATLRGLERVAAGPSIVLLSSDSLSRIGGSVRGRESLRAAFVRCLSAGCCLFFFLPCPFPGPFGFFRRRRCLCWLSLPLLLWVPGQRLWFFSTSTESERCDQVACAKVIAPSVVPHMLTIRMASLRISSS